jgi:hypothetical protein
MSYPEMKRLQVLAVEKGVILKTVSDFIKFAKEMN